MDRAWEAVWCPQGCDAACKPEHHGCSSRSLRPGRYGVQTSEVATFNSSQNALVFLKHLPFKLKWKKLHLPILPACKAALLPVALQISGVGNEMEKKLQVAVPTVLQVKVPLPVGGFVCAVQPGPFHCQNPAPARLFPAPVWPLLFPVCIRVRDTDLNA